MTWTGHVVCHVTVHAKDKVPGRWALPPSALRYVRMLPTSLLLQVIPLLNDGGAPFLNKDTNTYTFLLEVCNGLLCSTSTSTKPHKPKVLKYYGF